MYENVCNIFLLLTHQCEFSVTKIDKSMRKESQWKEMKIYRLSGGNSLSFNGRLKQPQLKCQDEWEKNNSTIATSIAVCVGLKLA